MFPTGLGSIKRCTTHQQWRFWNFFSGAFGGWKSASHHLAKRCANNFSYQMVAVEHDLNAAIAYAIGHASLLTKVGKDMPVNLFNRSDESWVAWGDVLDASLLQAVCHWQPQIVTLSPPCQPWSGAGKTKGLEVIDGMIFPQNSTGLSVDSSPSHPYRGSCWFHGP